MRSDMLISVVVADVAGPGATIPRLSAAIADLAHAFRYFEVLYVIAESRRPELDRLGETLAGLTNLRVIVTGDGTRYYRRRLIGAREAIGDVVAVADLDELPVAELITHIGEAADSGEVMAGWCAGRRGGGPTYRLFSLVSRFVLTPRAARTIILPREWLGAILARQSAVIELRFQPRVPLTRYRRFEVGAGRGESSALSARYEVLVEILRSDASRYLKAYALAGFLVALGALAYLAYAVAIVLLRSHVQEGWFSNAVVQAGSTAFIAGGMSILSIAMMAVLDGLNQGHDRAIIAEIGNTNYFDVASGGAAARNVELS